MDYFITFIIGVVLALFGVWIWGRAYKLYQEANETIPIPGTGREITVKDKDRLIWRANGLHGFSTEMFGAAVTTILLGIVLLFFQNLQAEQRQKEMLILQMGSPDNGFALEAARQLAYFEWLYDGSLQEASFWNADLQNVYLWDANLQNAYFDLANLQNAYLRRVNLQGAYLEDANLQNADLWEINLQGAFLRDVNFQGAFLRDVNLQGADLRRANLQNATLEKTLFNETTFLPDGTQWTPNRDLTEFTDPSHPNFWQGYNVKQSLQTKKTWQNANLQGTDLQDADLRGVNLESANVQGAFWAGALFDENTILPDGTNWTPDRDLTEFTDPPDDLPEP